MSRKYHTLRLGDSQYRLRLTIRGQNNLRDRFQEDTIQTVLGAATDSRRMVALLEEALNWEGNENPVTDGERFYDLLVDQGYCGQIQFSGLAFDIAACSWLVTVEQAKTLTSMRTSGRAKRRKRCRRRRPLSRRSWTDHGGAGSAGLGVRRVPAGEWGMDLGRAAGRGGGRPGATAAAAPESSPHRLGTGGGAVPASGRGEAAAHL